MSTILDVIKSPALVVRECEYEDCSTKRQTSPKSRESATSPSSYRRIRNKHHHRRESKDQQDNEEKRPSDSSNSTCTSSNSSRPSSHMLTSIAILPDILYDAKDSPQFPSVEQEAAGGERIRSIADNLALPRPMSDISLEDGQRQGRSRGNDAASAVAVAGGVDSRTEKSPLLGKGRERKSSSRFRFPAFRREKQPRERRTLEFAVAGLLCMTFTAMLLQVCEQRRVLSIEASMLYNSVATEYCLGCCC
jgi:hypothetical protein